MPVRSPGFAALRVLSLLALAISPVAFHIQEPTWARTARPAVGHDGVTSGLLPGPGRSADEADGLFEQVRSKPGVEVPCTLFDFPPGRTRTHAGANRLDPGVPQLGSGLLSEATSSRRHFQSQFSGIHDAFRLRVPRSPSNHTNDRIRLARQTTIAPDERDDDTMNGAVVHRHPIPESRGFVAVQRFPGDRRCTFVPRVRGMSTRTFRSRGTRRRFGRMHPVSFVPRSGATGTDRVRDEVALVPGRSSFRTGRRRRELARGRH